MKKLFLILFVLVLGYACSDDDDAVLQIDGISYSTFTDSRDGREYRCMTINGRTWMAENLSYRLPTGSWDGCYTYYEEQMDSTDLNTDPSRMKQTIDRDLASGAIANPPANLPFILPYLDYGMPVNQFMMMFAGYPDFYAYLGELDNKLKAEAKDGVARLFLDKAEQKNGGYAGNYGFLYTHEGAKLAVPEGWRLPTDEDWKELEQSLGMDKAAADAMEAWRGGCQGLLMKEGDKGCGFDVKMGGGRIYGAVSFGSIFQNREANAYFWTATERFMNDSTRVAVIRKLSYNDDRVFRGTSSLFRTAYSVRCIKK